MLVGVAAAQQENPEAGTSWDTRATFPLSAGYNYVSGYLAPGDTADYWRGPNDVSGVSVQLHLDQTSYLNGGIAQMYEGSSSHPLMQRVQNGNNGMWDSYLNTAPVYVSLTPANLGDYTFCVQWYNP